MDSKTRKIQEEKVNKGGNDFVQIMIKLVKIVTSFDKIDEILRDSNLLLQYSPKRCPPLRSATLHAPELTQLVASAKSEAESRRNLFCDHKERAFWKDRVKRSSLAESEQLFQTVLAKQYNADEQIVLAWLYMVGQDVHQSYVKAIKLLERASWSTDTEIVIRAALLRAEAQDALERHDEATQALLQAAAFGSGLAHVKLLIRKFFGLGCSRDFLIAANWMTRCASLPQDDSNYASVAFARHLERTCGQTLCEASPVPKLFNEQQLQFQLKVFARQKGG